MCINQGLVERTEATLQIPGNKGFPGNKELGACRIAGLAGRGRIRDAAMGA